MKRYSLIAALLILIIGCGPLEIARLLGVGTRQFIEKGKINLEEIEADISTCYKETFEVLQEMGAKPYRGNVGRKFIVAFGFHKSYGRKCINTTEVAFFFRELEENKTQVEISSLNYGLSDFIAKKIFSKLKKRIMVNHGQ